MWLLHDNEVRVKRGQVYEIQIPQSFGKCYARFFVTPVRGEYLI